MTAKKKPTRYKPPSRGPQPQIIPEAFAAAVTVFVRQAAAAEERLLDVLVELKDITRMRQLQDAAVARRNAALKLIHMLKNG